MDRDDEEDEEPLPESVELPIDGVLDLHPFQPKEVADLVATYLEECHAKQIFAVRLIHGKGIGAIKRTVEAALAKHPRVKSFRTAGEDGGGWGATLVELLP